MSRRDLRLPWSAHQGMNAREFTIWGSHGDPIAIRVPAEAKDLIAAAPEMLEALEYCYQEAESDRSEREIIAAIQQRIGYVIKKAKGEV